MKGSNAMTNQKRSAVFIYTHFLLCTETADKKKLKKYYGGKTL